MLPEELHRRATVLQRLLGITLGRTETAGTCAGLMTGLTAR